MTEWNAIQNIIPYGSDATILWEAWEHTAFGRIIERMKKTPQNPIWHGEGDVFTHTKMVCTALISDPEYQSLERRKQEILFLSALMHDIGKTVCTVTEDGILKSPKHTSVGANMARTFLWSEWNLCGTEEKRSLREAVCTCIRYHGMPLHLEEREDPERNLIEIASYGELAADFSLRLLQILVRADIKGRIAADIEQMQETMELSFLLAEDLDILEQPYRFPDEITKHDYLSGKKISRDHAVYDDTWKEVILVAGLPGTGKDTWIQKHYSSLPMISLDDIRREMNISPTDREAQGTVVSRAKEIAKDYLRKGISFVWNATNVTPQIRKKQLDLFERYHAYTHIVFLETALETEFERNRERKHTVPVSVIEALLSKTELPAVSEAHTVEWLTV